MTNEQAKQKAIHVVKEKLFVSVSGGETSVFMAQLLWRLYRDKFEMIFGMANTGREREETLIFAEKSSYYFGFPLIWLESVPYFNQRKSSGHIVTDYVHADRKGYRFEQMIKKYGIPNAQFKHCTRELKLNPIKSYLRSIGWENYYTAIGIREDEIDRVNSNHKSLKLIYPLADPRFKPMTKPKINFWWSQQPFRLELKGYQGNCEDCYKKSDPKLMQIAKERPSSFDFPQRMEREYGTFYPPGARKLKSECKPVTFYRGGKSAKDILNAARNFTGKVFDDSSVNDHTESCDLFSNCGDEY